MVKRKEVPSVVVPQSEETTTTSAADEFNATLQDIYDRVTQEFPGPEALARLEQFQSHLQTAMMAVSHLFEEAERMDGYR